MAKDLHLSRKEEQRGTRSMMMWGAIVAAIIFVALFVLFLGPFALGL